MTSHSAHLLSIVTGSPEPIYRQLIDQVRRLCAAGVLAAGDSMPSVREVAQALAVNPMTVSKAYGLLEMEGVLERARGVGMLVARRQSAAAGAVTERESLLRPTLERAAQEARQLELDPEAVIALFRKILEQSH
ncbi:GntR family transcriptional regulator [Oxalobacteraceae bacterium A2-2]